MCIYRLADVVLGSSVKFRNFKTALTKNFRQLVIGSRSRVLGLTLNVFQIVDFLDKVPEISEGVSSNRKKIRSVQRAVQEQHQYVTPLPA